jgi:hypothetical protein
VKFPIGAMSVGDILDRGLKITLARLPTFYVINLIVLLPILLVRLLVPSLFVPTADPSMAMGAAVGGLLVILFALLLGPIGTAASLHVISQEFADRHVGIDSAFNFAFSRFLPLLGASLLVGLIVGGIFFLMILLAGFMGGLFGAALGAVPGLVLTGVIVIVLAIPVIAFILGYLFVSQVVVVEGVGALGSLERSKSLANGYRWRLFGLLLLLGIIHLLFGGLGWLLGNVLSYTEPVQGRFGLVVQVYNGNYVNYAIFVVFDFALELLVSIYGSVCLTLLYFDIRIRKEGFDLDLAAQEQIKK